MNDKVKITAYILSGILLGFVLYGAKRFYFDKPKPQQEVKNQTITVEQGGILNMNPQEDKKKIESFIEPFVEADTEPELRVGIRCGLRF